jgi:PspA/IM30 family
MINSNSLWLLLAIVVVAGINDVQGFLVPQTTKSCSFVSRSVPHYKQTQAQAKVSSSALQMNLFDRFTRVVKGNLNTVLQSLEDPEKIMTQAVEDMQVRTRECDRYIFLFMYRES